MQNLHPSNVNVILQRPSCDVHYSGGFRFHSRYCRCASAHTPATHDNDGLQRLQYADDAATDWLEETATRALAE